MMRATLHGQDLTGDLLAFSRRRQLNPQPVDVNALVENIVRLLGRTLGANDPRRHRRRAATPAWRWSIRRRSKRRS